MTILNHFSPQLERRTSRHVVPVEPPRFRDSYFLGCDLGQSNDPTALCIVRKHEEIQKKSIFQVGHLARVPLNTPYPAVVGHVIALLGRPEIRGKCELVIDFTGVGRPVYDLFKVQGISPIGVNITGGTAVSHEGLIFSVPKSFLISRVQALLHEERLHFAADLPDLTALLDELQNFRVEFTDSGYMRFNARAGKHDDLLLALAIAVFRAYGDEQHTGILEYYEGLVREQFGPKPAQPQTPRVTLKRLGTISTVQTIKGRTLNVPESGLIELDNEEEAAPFLQAGWKRVAA